MIRVIKLAMSSLYKTVVITLQEEFTSVKVKYFQKRGFSIHKNVYIAANVNLKGKVSIDDGSSIAENCILSGGNAGISIGKNVMIAPNVVIIAFSHGIEKNGIPMSRQENIEDEVFIEDDVWISANCTIGKGVRISKGAVVAANSFVNKDVPPYAIVGGVPAKFIKERS